MSSAERNYIQDAARLDLGIGIVLIAIGTPLASAYADAYPAPVSVLNIVELDPDWITAGTMGLGILCLASSVGLFYLAGRKRSSTIHA